MINTSKWIAADPDEPVADVARRSTELRLAMVQSLLPLAADRWRENVEYVHALRVASRRSQAALVAYGELMPEWRVSRLRKQLKRIRSATNDARDDDVFALRLEQDSENSAAVRLARRVRRHRESAQAPIQRLHRRLSRDERFEKRCSQLVRRIRLRGKDLKRQAPTFNQWATVKFTELLNEFDRLGRSEFEDVESMHRFRICGKKIRYALELFASAFPRRFDRDMYSGLAKLQDRLGGLNDHASAVTRIDFWIAEAADGKKKEIRYLQEMRQSEYDLMLQSREQFINWWNRKREVAMVQNLQSLVV